jgi:hypothetical protein
MAFPMRALVLVGLIACSSPNPEFCCVTEDQCVAAGVDSLRPCDVGQACNAMSVCVAAECTTSAECTSLDAPNCSNGLCVAGCVVDDDCSGISAAPHCASDGVCVGCVDATQCTPGMEICDPEARACRGCMADNECASGVCIEVEGRCAADDELLFLVDLGDDGGTCTKEVPCRTIARAKALSTSSRRVLKVLGGSFSLGGSTVSLTEPLILDGSNTLLQSTVSSGLAAVSVSGLVVMEGFEFAGPAELAKLLVFSNLSLFNFHLRGGTLLSVDNGKLKLESSVVKNVEINCKNGGETTIEQSQFDRAVVFATNCTTTIRRSRFVDGGQNSGNETINVGIGTTLIENSVFIESIAGLQILNVGGTFRFNTVVHRAAQGGSTGMVCDGLLIESSVIALNTTRPLTDACNAQNSVFDTDGSSVAMRGTNNVAVDGASIFQDRSNDDLHLAATSQARMLGAPGLVEVDVDGNPRPDPAGTNPDSGAFEAP